MQEVQLANVSALVCCGTEMITWHHLRRAIMACIGMHFPTGTPELLSTKLWLCLSLAQIAEGRDPLYLLQGAMLANSSDPRDKVFGLLGMLPPVWSQQIQPRYTDSPQHVYRDTIIAYIGCSRSLNHLALSGPSWIPDWSVPRRAFDWAGDFCSGTSSAEVSHPSPDVLMASSVSFDTVEATIGPLSDVNVEVLQMVRTIWFDEASHSRRYPTGETLAEACAWVLNDGRLSDRHPQKNWHQPTLTEAQFLFQRLQKRENWGGETLPRFHIVVEEGGFLFRTAKGYFGATYSPVSPGDQLSTLLGCSLPTILRVHTDNQHLFVGCAYVHGIMDGEAFLGPLPEGWKVDVRDKNQQYFKDPMTGVWTPEDDPRLPPLPPDWEYATAPDLLWPNKKAEAFRNIMTGEILHSDPRWLPDALRARSVPLKMFALV
jgi:hypothetical protein